MPYIVLYIVLLLTLWWAARAGWRRRAVQLSVVIAAACVTSAAVAGPALAGTGPSGFSNTPPPGVAAAASQAAPRRPYVPDLIAAVPGGITSSQLTAISRLAGVEAVLPVDGGKVTVNGQSANLLGVSPQAFRSWTPLSTLSLIHI